MKKKQAGIERAYTIEEFSRRMIQLYGKQEEPQQCGLDYFLNDDSKEYIVSYDTFFVSFTVKYGGAEGIYAIFYLDYYKERVEFAIAKTLYDGRDAYIEMSLFAAKFTHDVIEYIDKHTDEFSWSGWEVGHMAVSGFVGDIFCPLHENAIKRAEEAKKHSFGSKVYIKDLASRDIEEFND